MKKKLLGFLFMFCALPFIKAQENLPFVVSPYAGVTAGQVNPASLAGSKYKFDVTLFGLSSGMHNDLLLLSRKKEIFSMKFYNDLLKQRSDFLDLNASRDLRNVLEEYLGYTRADWTNDSYAGNFWGRMDVLNLMYSVSDRLSLGLGYSHRFTGSANSIPNAVAAKFFYGHLPGTDNPALLPSVSGETSTAALAIFNQVSLTGAYTIMDKETSKLKIGLTAKVLFGGKSAFAYSNGYTVNYSTGVASGTGEAGVSTKGKLGFAADLGVEYEYRPAALVGNEIAEYRFKAGLSLLDLGGFGNSETNYRDLNLSSAHAAGVPRGINELIAKYGTGNQKGDYTMGLPTVVAAQLDYRFGASPIFLAFNPYIALNQSSAHKASSFTSFNLTPHAEWKNFGVSVPIQYDQYGKMTAGLGLRAWRHVWLGSNTLLKNLWPGKNEAGFTGNYSADFHVMVKVPILKEGNDRDKDGVPDKIDRCPDTPGLKKFQGCPDTDGDGIPDIDDRCPNDPGPASTQGCPDRDGDGIPDIDDRCPDQPGPAELQGCPDRDGDGVPDIDDRCPDLPGPKEFKGCPDTDGDGIPDIDDACPNEAGPKCTNGCPDRDGDCVADKDDACPDEPGPKENNGCPLAPKIQSVEFDFDKYVVKAQYYGELDKVVEMMTKDTELRVLIVGHTDNIGTHQYNVGLSKRRAEAVRSYLLKKKADSKRINTEYYSFDKPIADNSTAEGRAKNRRAEITIIVK